MILIIISHHICLIFSQTFFTKKSPLPKNKSADTGRGQQACEICWLLVVCVGAVELAFWGGAGISHGTGGTSHGPGGTSHGPGGTSPPSTFGHPGYIKN